MFEDLTKQPTDKIMALMSMYAKDDRKNKIDLGVGVYRDKTGNTPIMTAVKKAELELHGSQKTKSYVGLLGSLNFVEKISNLTLGTSTLGLKISGAQAPGGTGALHQLFLLIRAARPSTTVWLSDPTWPNHPAILKHLGLKSLTYRYFDESTCEVDFGGMMNDLSGSKAGDIVLLHGCCHNPTGANLDFSQWKEITTLCVTKNLVPLIDIAYQGFGDGLDADVVGLRHMASSVPNMMIATSCSKNFGIYRDRVGAALVVSSNQEEASLIQDNLKSLNRLTFSFPPDHGAAVVDFILGHTNLENEWRSELERMRERMLATRMSLAAALKRETNSNRFDFIQKHRGMFSRLGLSKSNVEKLRNDFGIYMVEDSRINIAGLQADNIDLLAASVANVI